ncbi:UDP-glucose 4-epimerase [hydrothermal vent metagenome]|uniref:UDP-glucose 4-epimerase n=1 Tax=hydrothermal vent metagenome TaxID=652676 RepID=A0A1W1CHW7_9ZZZZ
MNIFITGSNGFVGSHLKEYLQSNHTDYFLFTPSSNELDLYDEMSVDKYIIGNKIDLIIHTANRGGDRTTLDMKNITEYNLKIFFNIVKHEKNVKKIISFGSGAEYGKHKAIIDAKEEDYLQEQPLEEYGFYKSITSKYIEKSDNIVQLRIFGAYGENENYRFKFISNAIVKNLLNLPIVINKNVYFDYIYIADLVKMIAWFIENDTKEKVYNVTTGKKVDLVSNERVLKEIGEFTFTTHKEAIMKMREYFRYNLDSLDKESIINDPYLKKIDNMWKKED